MTQKLHLFILDLLFKSPDNAISLDYSHVGAGDLGALVWDPKLPSPDYLFSDGQNPSCEKIWEKHHILNILKPLN